ncbi:amidohydrolase [Acinetobacter dispersus]|uniref:amidohydrolase n=1 Tax=Acinetobacter dispersus TaxID=70348 RepID=UPI001F4ACF45|nr:amidohydrolase [Acinetobacter dispersus]MCH7383153.1 amidohydrolase [Acinetobacter dispersus]
MSDVQLILRNAKITTLDEQSSEAQAIAIADGKVVKTGSDDDIMRLSNSTTKVIDLNGRRVIPGLNDSHLHIIRGGLNYNMELRWEGVPSLSDALRLLKEQAENTPAPQWVRVVGGWTEFQFVEKRMPTLEELNRAAPDTPVFVLHLYASAMLNRAALDVLGFNKDTPDPPGGKIERNERGEPTGLFLATPSAMILYSTLGKAPKLPLEDQVNSTRHFMRELNRLGITSAIDAGGGGQNYPDDYEVIQSLHNHDQMTVRIAYNLFAQKAGEELDDYKKWTEMTFPNDGDELLKVNGAGENLTWSAGDFENFYEPRPDLPEKMEAELESIVELLAEKKWPFRIHATYDESINRLLNVFERVNGRQPFATRFIIDHAETVSDRNIERIGALGGGIAIQHRMAYQGEIFVQRYGSDAAKSTPPVKRMLELGVPVGAGTDATRVASYNPWVCLSWLSTGKTVGGLPLYDEQNLLDRKTALKLWTKGSAWFSGEHQHKGALSSGELADLIVLSDDYFAVDDDEIQWIESVMTVMNGKIVYAGAEFKDQDPSIPPASPDWSPVKRFGGQWRRSENRNAPSLSPLQSSSAACACSSSCGMHGHSHAWMLDVPINDKDKKSFWGALGCSCFAF